MNVTCPACSTMYRVDPQKIPAGGINALCARCDAEFPIESAALEQRADVVAVAEMPAPPEVADVEVEPFTSEGEFGGAAVEAEPSTSEAEFGGAAVEDDAMADAGASAADAEIAGDAAQEETEATLARGAISADVGDFGGELPYLSDTRSSDEIHAESATEAPSEISESAAEGEPSLAGGEATYDEPPREEAPDLVLDRFGSGLEGMDRTEDAAADAESYSDAALEGRVAGYDDEEFVPEPIAAAPTPEAEVRPEAVEPETVPAAGEFTERPAATPTDDDLVLPPPPFGSPDPHARAQRLARALVSDIIVYNPERRERSLQQGTLRQEFRDEIRKSWEEYVSHVGNDLARETSYFRDALNDLLARGTRLF